MELLLDTANLNEIRHCNEIYDITGVTTNPTIISREKSDFFETLEETVLTDERKRVINNALCLLSDDMRIVIHLVYFENLSYKEAARVMKKNHKQIDNLLYRAKKELRVILGKDGELLR